MPGFSEEVGFVGGQQIKCELTLLILDCIALRSGNVLVVLTERSKSVMAEPLVQSSAYQSLLAVRDIDARLLADEALEEAEFRVSQGNDRVRVGWIPVQFTVQRYVPPLPRKMRSPFPARRYR